MARALTWESRSRLPPNFFTFNSASVGNLVRAAEPLVNWVL